MAFGSLVAALIPLAVGQLAIATTLAITGLLAQRWHLSILVQNLATMLGLGLGIDYALLMVSRFREAIAAGHDGIGGSVIAARQAGRTLLISASTVAIGFLALLTVPISEIRSIGVAGIPGRGDQRAADQHAGSRGAWRCSGAHRCRPPAVYAEAGCAPGRRDGHSLAEMGTDDRRPSLARASACGHSAAAARLAGAHLDTSVPQGDWLPQSAESVHALHTLEHMDRAGIVESLRVIVELPKDSIAQTDAGWNALRRTKRSQATRAATA